MSVPGGLHFFDRFAEDLVKEGLVTSDQLTVAQVSQQNLGGDLARILIKKGFVTEEQLLNFLGHSLSIPYVHLHQGIVQSDLIQKIPLHFARRHHLIPLKEENGKVRIGMSDPLDRVALEGLRDLLQIEVAPVLASSDEIDRLIDHFYGTRSEEKGKGEDSLEIIGYLSEDSGGLEADEGSWEKLEKIATGPQIVQTVNEIIAQAYKDKASDIHLEPSRMALHVRYRIDGLLEERKHLPRDSLLPIISRVKILAGLDIAERRIPQDGRVRMRIGGNHLDLRVSTFPTLHGEKMVLRLLSKETVLGVESLGFSEKDRKTFSDLIGHSHGIFLVTGPTGSGKSTTLYAALSRINTPEKNIISVEDPVEGEITGVNQSQINPKGGVTFASALRAILRQDPDVIMIGEIRDPETAEIAVRAAITGHFVLSTLHTNTAAGTISRLIDLGVEPFLLSSALIGVLAQRLVRKVCPHCRVEVDLQEATRLGPIASAVKKNFRGQGCPACRMSGFSGRKGIFELAPISETVRRMIGERATDHQIEQEFRRLGVRSVMEDGMDNVNKGVTTIGEVLRVTQED